MMGPRPLRTPIAHRLRSMAVLSFAGLAVLAASTFFWGFLAAGSLAARPDNPRRLEFDRRIRRGAIIDRNGAILARTVFDAEGTPDRQYPVPAAAPVTGYQTWRYGAGLGRLSYGAGGAEAAYDAALRGDLNLGPKGLMATRLLNRPQVGLTVTLTLDKDLQVYASNLLGDREGAVVVLDVGSGAVRALVSNPTFDPAALDQGEVPEGDPKERMFNRATQGLYPPGSIWKTVTLAAGVDSGMVDTAKVVDDGDAVETFEGFPVRCNNNPQGVNRFDIVHAFGWSCNVTFARMGVQLGEERYRDYAERFGTGDNPPFPLPVRASQLSSDRSLPLPELASAAFGQGEVLVTPMHMALIAVAMATDGVLPTPYLLEAVEDQDAARLEPRGPWRAAVSQGTALTVRRAMITSVEEGWAAAAVAGTDITAGGKTGTAQVEDGAPHSWFIGFAPAQDPRLAIAVLVVHGGEGSAVAAPIAGRTLARGLALDTTAREQP